jgi:hypothetical protein
MGLCRGLSLLLGAAAAGGLQSLAQPFVLSAAGTLLIYIAAVTALAEREENPAGAARLSLLPPPAMLAGLATFYAFTRPWALLGAGHPAWLLSLAAGSAAVLSVAIWGVRVALDPCKARPAVGRMIWALLPLQAAFIAAGQPTGWTLAVAVLCLWPAVWLLPQRSIRS